VAEPADYHEAPPHRETDSQYNGAAF